MLRPDVSWKTVPKVRTLTDRTMFKPKLRRMSPPFRYIGPLVPGRCLKVLGKAGRRAFFSATACSFLLGACAQYTPLPLATTAPLAGSLTEQGAMASTTSPLTVPQVVALALENNPDLRALRARHGIARSQLLQAGVLPNPSLSGSFLPLLSGIGSVPAWTISLTQDIKSLITYRSKVRGAEFSAQQVDAEVLWQEWQVAGQARQLAVDLIEGARSRPLLEQEYNLLSRRNDVLQQALAAGNATLVMAAPTLVALQSARTSLDALDQRQLHSSHQLNALLGLVPSAILPLAANVDLPPFEPDAIRAQLASLPDRRPDLLALRLGYAAQDEAVHEQILAQFPDLVLGASTNSDNARVINGGPQATIGLPIFDRNQGNIAIARATRAQLNAAYSARLAAVTGEVGALLREMKQLSDQLAVVRADLPAARLAATRAAAAFGASNLDERSYVDLLTNSFTKEQEVMTLELALLDRQVALQTLVGADLPSIDTLSPMPVVGTAKQ
jgi:outer membrane protein TolC